MITTPELQAPANTQKPELIARLPSSSGLHQEGSKIIHGPSLAFDQVTNHLGLSLFQDGLELVKNGVPDIDQRPNLTKVRLAKAAALHEILHSTELPDSQTARRTVEIIMTDRDLINEAKTLTRIAEATYTQEAALQQDLSYIRQNGGIGLEGRFLGGALTRSQAVAIASVFESGKFSLSSLEKARLLHYLSLNQEETILNLRGGKDREFLKELVLEIRLFTGIFDNVLDLAAVGPRHKTNKIPLTNFTSILSRAVAQFRKHQTAASFEVLVREILAAEGIPEKIKDLKEVIPIIKNHPEVKAVSFDLYDTLVSWTSNQAERRERMSDVSAFLLKQKYGLGVDRGRFHRTNVAAWNKRWQEYHQHGHEAKIEEIMGWMIDDLLNDPSVIKPSDAVKMRAKIIKDLEKTWYQVEVETAVVIPGAIDTLRALKAMGLKIGLTSNASWSKTHIQRVLHRFGLSPYFDTISFSSDFGVVKDPNRKEFFHHSWQKLKVKPEEIIHVGDNPYADVEGAKNAGGNAVLYENPSAFTALETQTPYFLSNQEAYVQKALEFHTLAQDTEAVEAIERLMERKKIPLEERERLRTMVKEVYQKTRDVIGPAYLAFSDLLLQKLASGESDLTLCLARDGLPFALLQKLLLHLEPERYQGADPQKVKYLYVSRKLLGKSIQDPTFRALFPEASIPPFDQEFQEKYLTYLRQIGVDKAKKIILTDIISGSGFTHEGLRHLLQNQKVEGYYMDSHVEDRFPTAHGFFRRVLGASNIIITQNRLLLLESLFGGPFQSVKDFIQKGDRLSPLMGRKEEEFADSVLQRGISRQGLLLLNHVAIKALIDATHTMHRRRLLNIPDKPTQEALGLLAEFLTKEPDSVWSDIWRSLPWDNLLPSQNQNELGRTKIGIR